MSKLELFLARNGCFEVGHSGASLGSHLLNTFRLLQAAEAPLRVCYAGGLHSIYGTNAFKRSILSARETVIDEFGPEIERLVYIFGHIDRPAALEAIPDAGGTLPNRKSDEDFILTPQDVADLRLLEAANLLEQGGELSRWPKIAAALETCLRLDA